MIGVSRLTYSMGQYRQLPERLRALHPKFRTPYVAIMVFGLVACLTILPGQADFLGTIYAFGAMLSFTIAHAAVSRCAIKHPDVERPWRGPGNLRWRGHDLPLFAVFGGLGTGIAFVVVTVLNLEDAGRGHDLAGDRDHDLRRVPAPPGAVADRDAQGRHAQAGGRARGRVRVGAGRVRGLDFSTEAVATAVRLAARRRRGIHVLVTITVPPNSPIDVVLPEQEALAASLIDRARVRGGRRVTGHWEKVRPGQAGRRIVEEAREIRARALVMSLPPRRAGASLFGKTLETVLAERPCRVIIDSSRGVDERANAA